MLDNDPRDKYLYEIMVFTGARKGSGMWKCVRSLLSFERKRSNHI